MYKLRQIKPNAIINFGTGALNKKLNNNPIPIPAILPKLIRLNFVWLKSLGFSSVIFIYPPLKLVDFYV